MAIRTSGSFNPLVGIQIVHSRPSRLTISSLLSFQSPRRDSDRSFLAPRLGRRAVTVFQSPRRDSDRSFFVPVRHGQKTQKFQSPRRESDRSFHGGRGG